jgi:hypothetical protein
MFISFFHTGIELLLWMLILRLAQIKLVKNYPNAASTAALSFLMGS